MSVESDKLAKLFVKKLTNLDFSYLDADRGLVGESWLIDIELSGELDEQGMVLDFGIVKKLVRGYIDTYIDHCLLVPVNYSGCDVLEVNEQLEIAFYLHSGKLITHRSIADAVARIPAEQITIESIRQFLLEHLKVILPKNVSGLDIRLYTEPGLERSYQYSHGLRKHDGNCQRIAHGHRSFLEIFVDEKRSEKWESFWFSKWRDIYLGTQQHLSNQCDEGYCEFQYQAPQGNFYLRLPEESCYLIESESTVENIAKHLAETIAESEPGKHIEVRAYEGIGKGAIAQATV